MKTLAALIFLAGLQGCGTLAYTPKEYPLRDGLVKKMTIDGSVVTSNGQPSKEQTIVYSYGGTQLASNLNDITALMVQQTNGEINKNFKVANPGNKKTIELKVNSLLSKYIFFHTRSEMQFTAKLGNGVVIEKNVNHASGDPTQDLNGCIAESVMTLLNDDQVRAYLAKE